MKSEIRPSEQFLLAQRLFTFFDEWLFYLLLTFLYVNDYGALYPVAAIGGTMIVISYAKQWYSEYQRFHNPADGP